MASDRARTATAVGRTSTATAVHRPAHPIMHGLAAAAALAALALAAPAAKAAEAGLSEEARRCLTQTVYFEARGEAEAGQRAVANVVLNRVEHPDFPDTVCGVVRQGGETPPCQFSWWCDGKSDRPAELEAWQAAETVVEQVTADPEEDITKGAVYFHSTGVKPGWRDSFDEVGRIGDHVYYRAPERTASAE